VVPLQRAISFSILVERLAAFEGYFLFTKYIRTEMSESCCFFVRVVQHDYGQHCQWLAREYFELFPFTSTTARLKIVLLFYLMANKQTCLES